MDLSAGFDLGILLTVIITMIGVLTAYFYWKGRLDEWKKGIDKWKDKYTDIVSDLTKDIQALTFEVKAIKTSLEKDSSRFGLVQRQSPLVPSEKAKKF